MSDARETAEWNRAADLMALVANCHRGKGGRSWRRNDFHPFLSRKRKKADLKDVAAALFPGQTLQQQTMKRLPDGNWLVETEARTS